MPISYLVKGELCKKLKISESDYKEMMSYISKKDSESKFYETIARLYIPSVNGSPEIFVDREARVKSGNEEYLMSPFHFLKLHIFLERMKHKNGFKY